MTEITFSNPKELPVITKYNGETGIMPFKFDDTDELLPYEQLVLKINMDKGYHPKKVKIYKAVLIVEEE